MIFRSPIIVIVRSLVKPFFNKSLQKKAEAGDGAEGDHADQACPGEAPGKMGACRGEYDAYGDQSVQEHGGIQFHDIHLVNQLFLGYGEE